MDRPLRALIVDDTEDDALLLVEELQLAGREVAWERVDTANGLRDALSRGPWDIVLADYNMPGFTGRDALLIVLEQAGDTPVIMVSGTIGEEMAVSLLQDGANDCVLKSNLSRIPPVVERTLADAEARRERRLAEEALQQSEALHRAIVEASPDGIVVIDASGHILQANQRVAALHGVGAPEDLIGRLCFELVADNQLQMVSEVFDQTLRDGHSPRIEIDVKRVDGTTFPAEVCGVVLESPSDARAQFVVTVHDLSERKQGERALEESHAHLSHLLDSAPTVIYALEPGSAAPKTAWIGASVERLLGYSVDEALAPGWWSDNLHPEDRTRMLGEEEGLFGATSHRQEYRFRHKDGRFLWIRDDLEVYRDVEDNPYRAIGTWIDISQRKRAEAALEASNRALRKLSEVNQAVVRADDERRLMREVCKIIAEVGGRALAWIGKALDDDAKTVEPLEWYGSAHGYLEQLTVSWADIETGRGPTGTAIRTGRVVYAEDLETDPGFGPWRRAAAEHGLGSSIALPLFVNGADVWGTLNIYASEPNDFDRDEVAILEELAAAMCAGVEHLRARAEAERHFQALQERKSRLEILNAVASADLAGTAPEQLIPTTVARLSEEFPGIRVAYAAIDPQGRTVVQHSAQPEHMADIGGRCADLSEAPEYIKALRTVPYVVIPDVEKDTRIAPLAAVLAAGQTRAVLDIPIRSQQSIVGLLCMDAPVPRTWTEHEIETLTDVAQQLGNALRKKEIEQEREEAELRFQQAQRMEAVGRLAGGVAHDFNNLLTVINSYADFVLAELRETDPVRDDIREIRKAGDRATSLTRQLLAFSRRQVMQPKVVDLDQVAVEMDRMLRRVLGEDIELVTVTGDGPHRVYIDPGQIEQVLMNLAVNARDAMPDGGKLTIETTHCELDEEYASTHAPTEPGQYVRLSVSDTGMGMSEEVRGRVFEPFFTTKPKGKGTGLGLATVYGIVKQSGGYIWVYSEAGSGTTFKIYLPRCEEVSVSPTRSTPSGSLVQRGSETVLLVEDEDAVRMLAVRMLSNAGYRVLTAANGGEALLLCESQEAPIHLLVTDVVMPVMNGRALADRLSSITPGMKVLYMSGYTDNAIVHHGVLDADAEFIAKPFSQNELLAKVRAVLDSE